MTEWKKVEGGFAQIWKPQEQGDTLEGVVVKKGESQYGVYLEIENEDGLVWQTPAHKMLQNHIGGFIEGMMAKIVFTGMKKGKQGMAMQYDVFSAPAPIPASTPAPASTPTPETASQRIQKALEILRGYGEKGAPLKGYTTAVIDALEIRPEIAEMVITAMKNEGWVVEERGKIKEV